MTKLELYKTAYSPVYKKFVKIVKVRFDKHKQPIFHAEMKLDNGLFETMLFRYHELTRYCL